MTFYCYLVRDPLNLSVIFAQINYFKELLYTGEESSVQFN